MFTVMKNGQSVAVFDTAQEARDYIQSMIDQGQTGFSVAVQVLDGS
jgi:hypothetical protein